MSLFKHLLIMTVVISVVFGALVLLAALTGVDLTLLVLCLIVGMLLTRR